MRRAARDGLSAAWPFVPGEALVKLKPHALEQEQMEVLARLGVRPVSAGHNAAGYYRVLLDASGTKTILGGAPAFDAESTLLAIKRLRASPGVAYAEPNYKRSIHAAPPNDPLFTYQWHYRTVNLLEAWDHAKSRTASCVFDSMLADTAGFGPITQDLGVKGRDDVFGNGLINANLAVLSALQAASKPATSTLVIQLSTTSLDFGSVDDTRTLGVSNAGRGTLTVSSATADQAWIAVTPGALGTNTVTVDRGVLTSGVHTGTIVVNDDGEAFGAYPVTSDPRLIHVGKDQSGLAFPIRFQFDVLAASTLTGGTSAKRRFVH